MKEISGNDHNIDLENKPYIVINNVDNSIWLISNYITQCKNFINKIVKENISQQLKYDHFEIYYNKDFFTLSRCRLNDNVFTKLVKRRKIWTCNNCLELILKGDTAIVYEHTDNFKCLAVIHIHCKTEFDTNFLQDLNLYNEYE